MEIIKLIDEQFSNNKLLILKKLRDYSVNGLDIPECERIWIFKNKEILNHVDIRIIGEEFCKLLCGSHVNKVLYEFAEVICVFIPEIKPMIGFEQNNPHHKYDVWEHTVKSVSYTPSDIELRLTMLFHDIGKPICYTRDEDGIGHFYGHPRHSSDMALNIMKRLGFSEDRIYSIKELILYHDSIIKPTKKIVRRWINKIGVEQLKRLIQIKTADTKAQSKVYQEERLSNYIKIELCINEVIQEQGRFCLKDMAVNGQDLIKNGVEPGAQVGVVLNQLFKMVLNGQVENKSEHLIKVVNKLNI